MKLARCELPIEFPGQFEDAFGSRSLVMLFSKGFEPLANLLAVIVVSAQSWGKHGDVRFFAGLLQTTEDFLPSTHPPSAKLATLQ